MLNKTSKISKGDAANKPRKQKPGKTHHRGKYLCTADLQFKWIEFDQTRKSVVV